jgi:hypothetical protein
MFINGLNPSRGYGSLCDEKILYPLGFMFMIGLQLFNICLVFHVLKNRGILSIKGSDVEDYYNHIQSEEKEGNFNMNEMLKEQSKFLQRELKCIFVLYFIIIFMLSLRYNIFMKL